MKNLTNELEEILKLSYEETLQNIVKFINSLDLTYKFRENELKAKFICMLDDWAILTNITFLDFDKFYEILSINDENYYLKTKESKLYISQNDSTIKEFPINFVPVIDKINMLKNFEDTLKKFENDLDLEYKSYLRFGI